jgi:hypothetical protein
MMDSTIRNLVVAWVLGFVFALVLVERWRRMGMMAAGLEPPARQEPPAADGETKDLSPVDRMRQVGVGVGESVVNGMKADVKLLRDQFSNRRAKGSPPPNGHAEHLDTETTAAP